MKFYMFLRNANFEYVKIPPPFLRKERVILLKNDSIMLLLANRKQAEIFNLLPYVIYKKSYFKLQKYEHGQLYENNLSLIKGDVFIMNLVEDIDYNLEEILAEVFNTENKYYLQSLKNNKVQVYMRDFTRRLILKYVKKGSDVLDLGSGPEPETLVLEDTCNLYCYDISEIALENLRRNHPKVKQINRAILDSLEIKFDSIFTSFGFLELADLDLVKNIIDKNLKDGGTFIACYLNKLAISDLLLNILQLRFGYAMQRLSGMIDGNHSRYRLAVRLINDDLIEKFGIEIKESYSICSILPPYYFTNLIGKLDINKLIRMDYSLSNVKLLRSLGDFKCIVGVKNA